MHFYLLFGGQFWQGNTVSGHIPSGVVSCTRPIKNEWKLWKSMLNCPDSFKWGLQRNKSFWMVPHVNMFQACFHLRMCMNIGGGGGGGIWLIYC